MKNALAAVASTLSLAALIGAGSAHAAAPSLSANAGAEGTAISVPVSHRCAIKRCFYDVRTVDGTATVGADYAAAQVDGKARRRRTFQRTLTIATVDDTACESDETFIVYFTLVRNGKAAGFEANETIQDNDCATGQPTAPATTPPAAPPAAPDTPTGPAAPAGPPVTTPANPSGAVITNNATPGTRNQSCLTPAARGETTPGGLAELGIAPCFVYVQCPVTAAGCVGTAEDSVAPASSSDKQPVAGVVRADVISATGAFRSTASAYCKGAMLCTAPVRTISMAAGDWLMVRCEAGHDEYMIDAGGDRYETGPIGLFCYAKVDIS